MKGATSKSLRTLFQTDPTGIKNSCPITLHVSETVPPVPVPDTPSGSEGKPAGTTALELEEEVEFPVVFDAVAVNV